MACNCRLDTAKIRAQKAFAAKKEREARLAAEQKAEAERLAKAEEEARLAAERIEKMIEDASVHIEEEPIKEAIIEEDESEKEFGPMEDEE